MNKRKSLQLIEIKTKIEEYGILSIEELSNKIKAVEKGFFIGYFYNEVIIGRTTKIPINRDLKMIRVFNKNAEIYAFRIADNKFRYRLRRDGIGEKSYIVEANQVLVGSKSRKDNGKTTIFEDNGSELTVPFDISVSDSKRLCIRTYNYVGFTQYGQATYIDSRIVGFTVMDKDGNISEVE